MIEQDISPAIQEETWWATADAPVRTASHVAFLIDGRMTMLAMCHTFLSAKHAIYIAAWGLTPDFLLVRGKHHRAGPDGSPEQKELLTWLSAKGLSEEDLHFWQNCEELSVKNVLSYAVAKGVDVRVLLWSTYTLPFMAGPKQVQEALEEVGVLCLLDDTHMGLLNHPLTAHHQKTVVVDGRCAFVGGIDMMMENNGDHDRWDTKGHSYQHLLRLGKNEFMPHSWHDVHMLFEGPAVFDVEHNFLQRWNAVVELHEMKPELYVPEPPPANASAALESNIRIQVTRTIPDRTYPFAAEDGIATILETYQKAFAQAKRSIYIENQYFWRRTFLGLENPLLGQPHPDMEQLLQTLAEALARGVVLTLVLPDNPNVGREFTDDGLNYLWEIAPKAAASGTLHVYTLGTSLRKEDRVLYRPIYVHGKVAIVDDEWMTVGSANLNNRGMRDDTEMNIAIQDKRIARAMRILLMAEHLGLSDEDTLFRIIEVLGQPHLSDEIAALSDDLRPLWLKLEQQLADPFGGMVLFAQQAKDNLLAIKAQQPLVGHLVPYIPHSQAKEYEVEVNPVNGWLEMLADV